MRKFIVSHFALYERFKSDWALFLGGLLTVAGMVGIIDPPNLTPTMKVLFWSGIALFSVGLRMAKKTYAPLRCGKYIAGSLILCGITLIIKQQSDTKFVMVDYIPFVLFFISLLLGFLYFKLFPVKWEELDQEQKYDYGRGAMAGNGDHLTLEEYKEWELIEKKYQ